MKVAADDLGGVIYLFYDRLFAEDRRHVEMLPSSRSIRVVPVEGLRHNTNLVVVGSANIANLFRCCLARDAPGIAALIRSAKRSSPATYEGLSVHFLHRRKHRWAANAHDRAQAIEYSAARLVRFAREKSIVLEEDGRRDAAAAILRDALERVPGSATLLVRSAEVLNALGAHDEAVDAFGHAIRADGRHPAVYHGLADAMIRAGRGAEVLPVIRHGLTLCPSDESLRRLEMQFAAMPLPTVSTTRAEGKSHSSTGNGQPALLPAIVRSKGASMSETLLDLPTPPVPEATGLSPLQGRAPNGDSYQLVLQRFHETFRPETYLEIGVDDGATLRLSRSRTIAIDPCFRTGVLPVGNQPVGCLYQMTSDEFFRKHDPTAILGQPVDMAFLDGMHWFEFLLRDFINIEKHCRRNSIVFLHDCLPLDAHVGRRLSNDVRLRDRSACPDWWAGDVWKTLLIIVRVRPDLRVVLFDAAPTGLVAITGLDPSSTALADRYFELIDEYKDLSLMDKGRADLDRLPIVGTGSLTSHDALSSLFWL